MNIKTLLATCLLGLTLGSISTVASAGDYVSINHGFGLSTYRPDHARPETVHRSGGRYDRQRYDHRSNRDIRHKARHSSKRYGKHRSHRYVPPRYSYGYPYNSGGISIYYGSGGSSIRYSAPLYFDRHRW